MGGEQSQKRDQIITIIKEYPYKQKQVEEGEFVMNVFQCLDLKPQHTPAGPLLITGTHVIFSYYHLLKSSNKGALTKSDIIDEIKQLYDDPQKAIQCSYLIIQPNINANITKTNFVGFVLSCFDRGLESILNRSKCDVQFKKSFKQWMNQQRPLVIQNTEKIFQEHAQSQSQTWTRGDFKRWILSETQWTIYISIRTDTFKIPLNIPCLFGISLDQKK